MNPATHAPQTQAPAQAAARRAHVLIVDDEESMRWFLERALRREGYDVSTAHDGPEAIRQAQSKLPDLVLTDVRMPGMDGVALMRALRSIAPAAPVVLMTAYGAVDDALAAMKQGAADYVTKPLRVEQVREVVAKSLQGAAKVPTVRDVSAPGGAPSAAPAPATSSLPAARRAALPVTSPTLGAFLRERCRERNLPVPAEAASGDLDLRLIGRLAELVYADELMHLTAGNVSRAAEIAGITRPNMHRKIQDLGLSADDYRPQ